MDFVTDIEARDRTLVLIGHSHTETVIAAAAEAGVALDALNFWQLPDPFVTEAGVLRLKPALAARLRGPVFSLVGGAVHQDVGLVVHPAPFDFVWPENPDLPMAEGAAVIPFDAVYAAMFERTQHFRDIMSAVRAVADGPVFHMESPPTYGPEELPQDDAGFFHFFGKDARFSPPWLRYKLWRVHSAIIAAHCREIGIEFVPHPAEAVDEAGFMRAPYHGTPAHANAAYGALVLAQMQAIAAQCPARAAAGAAEDVEAPVVDLAVEGWIDGIAHGVVRGWAWHPDAPGDKPFLEVLAGGKVVGRGVAVMPRADLAAMGKGDGACGFEIALEREAFGGSGGLVEVVVRVCGGGELAGGPVQADPAEMSASRSLLWPPVPWRFAVGLLGHIDGFGPDLIDGWAQDPAAPSAPVVLEIWEQGALVGTVTAATWRQDLEEMRQGDGRWGLSAAMPAALRDGRPHRIALMLPDGRDALGHPVYAQYPAPEGLTLPPQISLESPMEVTPRRVRPGRRDATPDVLFSIVVNFYNMRREAERTLTSLSRAYQRDIGALRYEVLCIDNFSDPPLDAAWVESFGPEFRLVVPSRRLSSPCAAINEAALQAHGRYVAIMIDGAHVLTPGALREVWDAVIEAPDAVVALRQWFVGGDQRWLATVGYTREQEDILFDKIAWPSDGYKLFRVGAPYWESPKPWFDAMIESNCLFVPKALYRDIGGMDEAFSEAGAGYANLDLFRRAADASPEPLIALLGEATFHQFHDGTTTNVTLEMKEQRVRAYESHYVEIRGKPYPVTQAVDIRLRGQIRTLQAISSWQRPSSPARIGATEKVRPGSLTLQFDDTAQEYAQSVYVEAGLHERTVWLGHRLDMAPSDAMAIQDIVFRLRPDRIVVANVAVGVIMLLDSLLALVDLPASRIVAVGDLPDDMPARVTRIAGKAGCPDTLAAVRAAVAGEERVLVLFSPDEGDFMPFDALRAFSGLVTPRSYLIFLGTACGQPWLGYSKHWYVTSIRRLLDTEHFAIDANVNPHLISTSPLGYLQRIEPPPHLAGASIEAAG